MEIYRTGPETDRLEHRALTLNDAEAFYALNSNVDVMKFTGEPMTQSVEEAREAIADYRDFDERGYGRWACVLKETQQVIGFCGLKYLTDLNEVDVGYRFLPEFWGKGLATEACAASIKFGFDTLGLEKIIGLVLPQHGIDPCAGKSRNDVRRRIRLRRTACNPVLSSSRNVVACHVNADHLACHQREATRPAVGVFVLCEKVGGLRCCHCRNCRCFLRLTNRPKPLLLSSWVFAQ